MAAEYRSPWAGGTNAMKLSLDIAKNNLFSPESPTIRPAFLGVHSLA